MGSSQSLFNQKKTNSNSNVSSTQSKEQYKDRRSLKVSYVHQLFDKRKALKSGNVKSRENDASHHGETVREPRTTYVNRLQEARGELCPYPVIISESPEQEEVMPQKPKSKGSQARSDRKSSTSASQQAQRTPTPARRKRAKATPSKFHHVNSKQRQSTPLKVNPLSSLNKVKCLKKQDYLSQRLVENAAQSTGIPTGRRRPDVRSKRLFNIQRKRHMEEMQCLSSESKEHMKESSEPTSEEGVGPATVQSHDASEKSTPTCGESFETLRSQSTVISELSDFLSNSDSSDAPELPDKDFERSEEPLPDSNNQSSLLDIEEDVGPSRPDIGNEAPPLPSLSELFETLNETSGYDGENVTNFDEFCRISESYSQNCRKLDAQIKNTQQSDQSSSEGPRRWKEPNLNETDVPLKSRNIDYWSREVLSDDSNTYDMSSGEWDACSVTGYSTPLSSESSKSLLTFSEAKRRIMKVTDKPVKKNLEYYKQLEELGLGYIKDGVWMPSDVVASLIWKNAEKKVESCEAKWVKKRSKSPHKIYGIK